MRKLLLLGLALLALYMAGRALKKNSEVIGLLWLLVSMTANLNTANTPKTRALEDRINALVPALGTVTQTANNALPLAGGTVTGNLAVNGNHNVGGGISASGSLSIGNTGQVNGAFSVGGALQGTSGTLQVSGSQSVSGNSNVNGNHTVSGGISAGGSLSIGNTANVAGALSAADLYVSGQRIAPGQGTPGGYPVSGSPSNAGLGTLCNQIIAGMQAAGMFA